MNTSDLIPSSIRDDIAWMVLEQGCPIAQAAHLFSLPRNVVSDAVEGFLRDAREMGLYATELLAELDAG